MSADLQSPTGEQLVLLGESAIRAGVPEGTTLAQVFDAWRERGLQPREITGEDFVQHVQIEHDTRVGQLTYRYDKADALQIIALLWDTIRLIARQELFSETRSRLTSGEAAIALALKDGNIEAIHDPPHDPLVLVGLLIADACKIMDEVEGEDFAPLASLAKLIRFETNSPEVKD